MNKAPTSQGLPLLNTSMDDAEQKADRYLLNEALELVRVNSVGSRFYASTLCDALYRKFLVGALNVQTRQHGPVLTKHNRFRRSFTGAVLRWGRGG